jgi:hypothetical protein
MPRNPKAAPVLALMLLGGAGAVGAGVAAAGDDPGARAAGREQSTQLISRAADGGTPNGASTHAVISGDRRYARVIAYESEASDLVRGDTNGQKDVFAVKRTSGVNNSGAPWSGGDAILVSRARDGGPADGPSFGAALSGDFRHAGGCVAFLSGATNLVSGDTNGKVDAFLFKSPGAAPKRVSPNAMSADADAVTISGDCSRVSFTAGGRLYTSVSGKTAKRVRTRGSATQPSYATGNSNALVYTARGGVWLSSDGKSRGKLVARGGRNPAFNDLKRRTVAYEKPAGGHMQIGYRDIGKGEKFISSNGAQKGNGDSRNPVIGNSGYYVTFETDAGNLVVNASGQTGDDNGRPDSYLFSDSRESTLVQSVQDKGVPLPGGGQNPSMGYYANYIVFDSPAPIRARDGTHQIYMRYLGGI